MDWRLLLLFVTAYVSGTNSWHFGLTTANLKRRSMGGHLQNVAAYGDAEQRGPTWYEDDTRTGSSDSSASDEKKNLISTEVSSSDSSKCYTGECDSREASSVQTSEKRMASRTYRDCTACPKDMLKKHKNKGIKWICGTYQRARRTFKSECMMRYRNCKDGTMFIKLYDNRCRDDPYHGRHWFYQYQV